MHQTEKISYLTLMPNTSIIKGFTGFLKKKLYLGQYSKPKEGQLLGQEK